MPSDNDKLSSRALYCQRLRVWLRQLEQARCVDAMFPIWLAQQLSQENQSQLNAGASSQATAGVGARAGNHAPPQQQQQQQQQQRRERGVEYRVPSACKRMAAETLDFLLLVFVKFFVTYMAIDHFEIIDISKFDVDNMLKIFRGESSVLDYDLAFEMTSEILFLEAINRVIGCIFEAWCLHANMFGGEMVGGATPGKRLLGISVVRCEWVVPSLDGHVLVYPGATVTLGWGRSLLRSFVKNASMTMCLPVCVGVALMEHGRPPYDLLAGSMVVEPATRP